MLSDPQIEKVFIQHCLKARLHVASMSEAKTLAAQGDFDWDLFLHTAQEELLFPLLYQTLRGQQIAPPAVEQALEKKYGYTARRNLLLLHELGQTLALFRDAGIDTIVLKGAALIETVYKNIAFRPMRDLDLLIRPEQLPEAIDRLAPVGYEQTSVVQRTSYPVALNKPGVEPVVLELHWSLFHSLYYQQQLSMDWFWQTACPAHSASNPMKVLGLEAQILHLCGHLALHHTYQAQLLWRNDLAELIFTYKDKIAWDLLIDKAQTFQLILPLRQILATIARDWGAPVPEQALQRLQTIEVSDAETRAFTLSTAVKQSEGQGYWFRLSEITGWRKRLGYIVRWFFPAPTTLRTRYRISRPLLLPLAYPYHWWSGARLGVEAFLTRLRTEDPSG